MQQRDIWGVATVAAATAGLIAYRYTYIEPREWGAICAAAAPAPTCLPRAAVLWLQREYLWGSISLALGLCALLFRAPFFVAVAAVVVGIAGVENYNATWSMVGAALGGWVWIGRGSKGKTGGVAPPQTPA